jgi:hypothetical protein
MSKFEPFPSEVSIGDKYNPATSITNQADANEYFERCVEHTMSCIPELSRDEAEKIERANIGYWAGYQSKCGARRMFALFNCSHPFLGREELEPEEILKIGMESGSGARRWSGA